VSKADVTPDDVLAMIIMGKSPGELGEEEKARLH
jgi:hypothetical protein